MSTIISMSKDGNYATQFAEKLGINVVRGSSSRGGARALVGLKKSMDKGYDVAITTDGPRGPLGSVNNGVIYLAKLAGKKFVPAAFYCDKKIHLKSWDKMMIPLPFSKGGFMFGEELEIPKDIKEEDVEGYREKIGKILFDLNEKVKAEVYEKNV